MFLLAIACTLMPFIEGSGWPDRNCGRSLVRSRDRFIFDGRMAKDGEFPWMVFLVTVLTNNSLIACGGSIIKRDVVLTAAHCVEGFHTKVLNIYAGSLSLNKRGQYTQVRSIEQFIIPEDYWGDVMPDPSHDIALVKLTTPFDFEASKGRIGTVCLADFPPRPGKVVTVAGWGNTSPKGNMSFDLLAVTVPVIKDKNCMNFYSFFYLPKIMFCAGENRKQAGKGDSGGPALVTKARKSLQVGIVAFGSTQNPYHSVVFTKVSSYIKWIVDALKKLE